MVKKWLVLVVVLGAVLAFGLVGLSQENVSVAKPNSDGSVAYSPGDGNPEPEGEIPVGCSNLMSGTGVASVHGICNDSQSDDVIELKAATESAMDWQCMVWWTKECLDYDTRNCDSCYIPCVVGCALACAAVGGYYWGASCALGCTVICNACPNCKYCVEWQYTRHKTCGWVIVE